MELLKADAKYTYRTTQCNDNKATTLILTRWHEAWIGMSHINDPSVILMLCSRCFFRGVNPKSIVGDTNCAVEISNSFGNDGKYQG